MTAAHRDTHNSPIDLGAPPAEFKTHDEQGGWRLAGRVWEAYRMMGEEFIAAGSPSQPVPPWRELTGLQQQAFALYLSQTQTMTVVCAVGRHLGRKE